MVVKPIQRLQVATKANAIGTMRQAAHINTDTFYTLLAATGLSKEGIFFERNTSNLILQPTVRWKDLTLSDWLVSVPPGFPPEAQGRWREVAERATGTRALSQYDATPGRIWRIQSPTGFLSANAAFAVKMQFGPPPKDAPHDRDHYYRDVYFPADTRVGETGWKVQFRYGEAPGLYYTNNGGASYVKGGDIPSPVDFGLLRTGKNVEFTLTVLQMDQTTVVWIGDIDRYTLYLRQDGVEVGATPAGTLGFTGMNGAFAFAFGDVRFAHYGRYHSYPRWSPRETNGKLQFVIQPAVPAGFGVGVAGKLETLDPVARLFTYTLEMTAPPIEKGSDVSRTTPMVKQVTVVWPPLWSPPPDGGWRDVGRVERIVEQRRLDTATGLLSSRLQVTLDNSSGLERVQGGVRAVQLFLGYQHTGSFFRGRYLANMRFEMSEHGGDADFTFDAEDLLFVLSNQIVTDDVYPSRWCVYALARLLLQMGQVVPALLRRIPDCPLGPDPPGCPHPKMAAHPGFKASTSILPCLEEVRQIIGGWMGQDSLGQFRFEPFDWQPRRAPARRFYEAPGNLGRNRGGMMNEILEGAARRRDLGDVRNDFFLIGFDQATGRLMPGVYQDDRSLASKWNPTAPNYLGFSSPLFHLSSIYATREFMDAVGKSLLDYRSLPAERYTMPCFGQPTVFPGDLIEVFAPRTVGNGVRYWVEEIGSNWEPGGYYSTIGGQWVGIGPVPGTSGFF